MGIPKYHKWLEERYPNAFSEAHNETADHVYVDVNALLHDVMRHASNHEGFYSHLFSKLDGLFRKVVPKRSVFLAVDGPASCAKCLTQRERRRAHMNKDKKDSKRDKGKGGKKGGCKGGGKGAVTMSNNMLTPGVPFMTDLTSALEYYVASRLAPQGVLARCSSATVSGARAVGEGEHKIVSQMLRHAGAGAAGQSHVIFSGDADIFLLSLVQSACRKVRVVSERPDVGQFGKGNNKRKGGMVLQVWNAEALAGYLHKELASSPSAPRTAADEAAVRRDFALVSLLAGNDYLPALRCGMSPQQLWAKYLGFRRSQFPNDSIIVARLTEEGVPPSHAEGGWALEVGEQGAAFVVEPYEHYSFHLPLLQALMKAAAAGAPTGFGGTNEGARKYLEGLLWIMEMYHHGYCGDFYFTLEKKFHSAASAGLIVKLLETCKGNPPAPSRSGNAPMRPVSCALCVLPGQQAMDFLCPTAPELRPMFDASHPLLGAVIATESSAEIAALKAQVTAKEREMMSLRAQGMDDSRAKAQLSQAQAKMQAMKQGGSDIDVVRLDEVDAEVQERLAGSSLPSLQFQEDVTLARQPGGEAFVLQPPVRNQPPARCAGLQYVTGEWPAAEEGALIFERREFGEAEAAAGDGGPLCFCHGDMVEAYWPEDDEWLPATVVKVRRDGRLKISWAGEESESNVPSDYVRAAPELEFPAPAAKRVRVN